MKKELVRFSIFSERRGYILIYPQMSDKVRMRIILTFRECRGYISIYPQVRSKIEPYLKNSSSLYHNPRTPSNAGIVVDGGAGKSTTTISSPSLTNPNFSRIA